VHVTLVEQLDRLLPFADREMVEALAAHLRENRVSLRLGETVESVEVLPLGTVVANLASKKRVSADALLWAVGRQANSGELNLDAVGVSTGSDGRITVNSNFQSSVEHIYATGDVASFPTLEATAMEQGRIAAAHVCGDHAALSNPCFYPNVLYTVPEIAFAGKTQEQLTAENVPFQVGVANFRETARGLQRGDEAGRLKLLFHSESRKVLGIHILGEGAGELLHLGLAVMALGGTVDYFAHAVFNRRSLAEGYKAAVRNANR
jgi:NAD(P) transhydrogenase